MDSDNSRSSSVVSFCPDYDDEDKKYQELKQEQDSAEATVKLEQCSVNDESSEEEKDQDETATSVIVTEEGEEANEEEEVQVLKEVSRSKTKNKRKVWTGKRKKRKNWNVQKKVKVEVETVSGEPKDTRYIYSLHSTEDHGRVIYGIDFYHGNGLSNNYVFATCGTNRVTIYECTEDFPIKLLQCYEDPDPDEEFYCCAWSDDSDGMPILAAAGGKGIIRIFSPSARDCIKDVVGHTASVNHLTFHPKDPNLMFSASKDQSCRLWNLKTDVLVAIFGGYEGHRDQVLFVDVDMTGSKIITTGIDYALMVWKLDKPEIREAIQKSYMFQSKVSHRPFKTSIQGIPEFCNRDIHKLYVDCARWHGDLIFSKSCEDEIVCWKAGDFHQNWDDILNSNVKKISIVARHKVTKGNIWFIRFSMDFWKHYLALGNNDGKIFLYDLTAEDPKKIFVDKLSHPNCYCAVRQTAFSKDGKILIAVCDDATVWRWDKNENYVRKEEQSKETLEKKDAMEKVKKEEIKEEVKEEQTNKEVQEEETKKEVQEEETKEEVEEEETKKEVEEEETSEEVEEEETKKEVQEEETNEEVN